MRGVDRLVEAVQAVIEWEVEYREMNHLGTWPPRVFQEMAIARAAILSSTSEPGLPHGILCQCPKCLPSSGGTPVSKLLEVVCPACGYDFPPRVANYPNAHCPNCRHDFNYAVTKAAPSEPQASEPPKPEYQDATIYFDEVPEQGSNRAMIYIWPKPQPESVSAQGNKQVFMCGCISYNTALVPRCPIHKQASEPPELSDKDGWLYDPDAKLAEIRAAVKQASEPPACIYCDALWELNPATGLHRNPDGTAFVWVCTRIGAKPQASEPRTYKGDLHKDLLDDDFALEYFKA